MRTLHDLDFKDKRVIVRVDLNLPVDESGNIKDDKRIKEVLPTIKYLLEKNAKIILISHAGRPKGEIVEKLKMDKVAERLSELLNKKVSKLDDCVGKEVENFVKNMKSGDVVFLENLRFHKEEKEKDEEKRLNFAKQLAGLADMYVDDAFSNSHRDHASMTGIPKFIPGCVGFAIQKEIETINKTMENPGRPFYAIISGLKADKIGAIKNLLKKVDKVFVGGALAFLFLKAKGVEIGDTKIDTEGIETFPKELLDNEKIVLPVDTVVADRFDENADSKIVTVDNIEKGWMALDIGPETIKLYKDNLKDAKTVIVSGTAGVFEWDRFANGTKEIFSFVADLKATTIAGGGDTTAAIEKLNLQDKFTFVSTGGGASLALFEGKELPAVKALE